MNNPNDIKKGPAPTQPHNKETSAPLQLVIKDIQMELISFSAQQKSFNELLEIEDEKMFHDAGRKGLALRELVIALEDLQNRDRSP
jgi:hypothetical protein